ncbi:helix-turn-helix domain-containing protein [Eubacteriales bacterium OttesenSCG-928-M02]|nr:helix-turn-helix domain-containing protein [Eubacteriales bacterium OttesenSCG-928-M02]
MVMSVKEMREYMGISIPKAYELTEREGFPVIHVGSRKLIPIEAFKRWLDEESAKSK